MPRGVRILMSFVYPEKNFQGPVSNVVALEAVKNDERNLEERLETTFDNRLHMITSQWKSRKVAEVCCYCRKPGKMRICSCTIHTEIIFVGSAVATFIMKAGAGLMVKDGSYFGDTRGLKT